MYRLRIHTRWYLPRPEAPEDLGHGRSPYLGAFQVEALPTFPSEEEAVEEMERLIEGHRVLYPGTEVYPLDPSGRAYFLTAGYRSLILEVERV